MRLAGVRAVAVSAYTAGSLARSMPASILPPAPARQWFQTLVNESNKVHERVAEIQLVTAFRLESWKQKGLPHLVAAVEALGRADVRLTVCGVGEVSVELRDFVSSRAWCSIAAGVTDQELAAHLGRADLFVLATRTKVGRAASGEGFGLVLLEAQIAGTPVIAPAHGGCSDAYVQGVTGLSPTDESVQTLSAMLDEILDDSARLTWMGKRATEWAQESFSPERYAELVIRKLL